jgi:uncharacterized membrane protein
MTVRRPYITILTGSSIALMASFIQLTDKITLLKNTDAVLTCNINSVFSCTNVLSAWQSSLFGFPNSMMAMVFFALVAGISLVGVTGSSITKGLRLTMQVFSILFLGFSLWFLQQSTFVIGSLCLFCLFMFVGLVIINAGWLRLNGRDLPIGSTGRQIILKSTKNGADIFAWIVLVLIVGFIMLMKFN